MTRLIKPLQENRKVIFDRGKFDDWCVYVVEADGTKTPPFDVTYFTEMQRIGRKYPKDKVYLDFVAIYDRTTKTIDTTVLDLIDAIVQTYRAEDRAIMEQWFAVIYGGMIAEENKRFAILKKRIKRLGMFQLLRLGVEPHLAANFSRGKNWKELDAVMRQYGF